MKIKQIPEDFVVEEIPSTNVRKAGPHAIFELKKRDMDLVQAKKTIAKKLKISYKEIAHAGIKDKIAVTTQLLSIKTNVKGRMDFQTPSLSLRRLGRSKTGLKSGDLKGNKFTITLRDLSKKDIQKIKNNFERIKSNGIPNYFDSQRFGEDLSKEGFIAKKLMRGDYEGALKLYLCSENNNSIDKNEAHNFIYKNWGKWMMCLKHLYPMDKLHEEKKIIHYLTKHPDRFVQTFRMINKLKQEMFMSAYQSYIWNKCLNQILKDKIKNLKQQEYAAGRIHIYQEVEEEILEFLKSSKLPMVAPNTQLKDEYIKSIVERILKKENIKQEELKVGKMGNLFFKTRRRNMIIFPKDFKIISEEQDDLNEGKEKLTISFSLEKGAYATMLIKCLGL